MMRQLFIIIAASFLMLYSLSAPLKAQKKDQNHLAFSGMTKEEATEVQKAAAEYYNLPLDFKITIQGNTTIEFVLIPPGEFEMGSKYSQERIAAKYGGKASAYDLEHPQHLVQITKPYYLSICEITHLQWDAIMDNNPSPLLKPNLPVEHVSWDDCKEFCEKLSSKIGKNFRLPTEAEWEFACRAGTTSEFSFGDELTKMHANCDSDRSIPVGIFPPNAWGLFDMHGNICEWVEDHYYFYSEDLKIDPWETEYPYGGRMLRGGAYDDDISKLRSAYRYAHLNSAGDQNCGFRIVCLIERL